MLACVLLSAFVLSADCAVVEVFGWKLRIVLSESGFMLLTALFCYFEAHCLFIAIEMEPMDTNYADYDFNYEFTDGTKLDFFSVNGLTPPLLERIISKLKDREYFRLQQTCKEMEQFYRTSHVQLSTKKRCMLAWKKEDDGSHQLCWHKKPLTGLYGMRFHVLKLPNHIRDFDTLCKTLKSHRITAEELPLQFYKKAKPLEFTAERCEKLCKILKPSKVLLDSKGSKKYETLLRLKELEKADVTADLANAKHLIMNALPRFFLKLTTTGSQDDVLDLFRWSIQLALDHIMENQDFCKFKLVGKWTTAPRIKELKWMFVFLDDDFTERHAKDQYKVKYALPKPNYYAVFDIYPTQGILLIEEEDRSV